MKVILGSLLGVVVAVGWNVGLQLLIWGNNAPDWYLGPIIVTSFACGFGGFQLGVRWHERG